MACCCAVQQTETENVVLNSNKIIEEERKEEPPAPVVKPVVEEKKPEPEPAAPLPAPEPVKEAEPLKPAVQVTVKLSKSGGKALGMEIAQISNTGLFVSEVKAGGAADAYNQSNGEAAGIVAGDILISANGKTENDIIPCLQNDADIELVVRKTKDVTLQIPKDGKLGMDIGYQEEKDYILVRGIQDGAVKTYNASASPDQQVKSPARILAVDGVRGKAGVLFEKIKGAGSSVELVLSQPID